MQVEGKVFAITGAGNGIARELSLQLLGLGARVAALDINAAGLDELRGLAGDTADRLTTHVINIVDRDAVLALPGQVIAEHGQVDGLLNIAGIIQPFVKINELQFDAIYKVVDVNFYGVVNTVKAFLPELLKRPEGHIVNVSSMGAYAPVPGQSIYGASKAAVKLLSEGLYAELLDTKVGVTIVFPGATATNIAGNSGIAMAGMDASSSKFKMTPPTETARLLVDGIEKNALHVFAGSDAKMMDRMARYAPNKVGKIIYKQMKSLLG